MSVTREKSTCAVCQPVSRSWAAWASRRLVFPYRRGGAGRTPPRAPPPPPRRAGSRRRELGGVGEQEARLPIPAGGREPHAHAVARPPPELRELGLAVDEKLRSDRALEAERRALHGWSGYT